MSEERLQEIKDSIGLQEKILTENGLNGGLILLIEEKELFEEVERLNNIINKTNWYLKQMLAQVENKETKAIINGALDLLLKEGDKE